MKTDLLTLNDNTTELIDISETEVRQNAKKFKNLNDMNADWVKKHVEKFGIEPNIFDGAQLLQLIVTTGNHT